ncbi:MAG: HAD family hydrolase [Erysipelotrichaceae bacterium]|nr:HAD family hydrolase [Erysipelotrichaceae bacterium]
MIKAILFDFDGTLSNRQLSAYRKYQDVVGKIFPDLAKGSIEFEGIVQRMMTWDEFGTIAKKHVYEQLSAKYDLDLDIDYWVKEWYSNFHLFNVLQDDCLEVLSKLHQDYKIGCITNGPYDTQMLKLEHTKVLEHFDVCLISKQVGIDKPDKKIFEMAATQLGLPCEQIAYVGDNFYADIYGAINCGMLPIWFFTDPKRISDINVQRIYEFKELLTIFKK